MAARRRIFHTCVSGCRGCYKTLSMLIPQERATKPGRSINAFFNNFEEEVNIKESCKKARHIMLYNNNFFKKEFIHVCFETTFKIVIFQLMGELNPLESSS